LRGCIDEGAVQCHRRDENVVTKSLLLGIEPRRSLLLVRVCLSPKGVVDEAVAQPRAPCFHLAPCLSMAACCLDPYVICRPAVSGGLVEGLLLLRAPMRGACGLRPSLSIGCRKWLSCRPPLPSSPRSQEPSEQIGRTAVVLGQLFLSTTQVRQSSGVDSSGFLGGRLASCHGGAGQRRRSFCLGLLAGETGQ